MLLILRDIDGWQPRNVDSMGERLSSLTTIVLGEGLNSLAGTLVIAFAFDGFVRRTLSVTNRSKLNLARCASRSSWASVLARTAMGIVVALLDERRTVAEPAAGAIPDVSFCHRRVTLVAFSSEAAGAAWPGSRP